MSTVQIVDISILRYIPELVAWGIGIILAVLMVRWGGGKAEKLLLAGCGLMFAAQLISLLLTDMIPWMSEQRISAQGLGIIRSLSSGLPSLTGIICLVIAFRFRFRRKKVMA